MSQEQSATSADSRLQRFTTWLASARARRALFLVGGLLALPSISGRLVFDDHLQALLRMPKPPIDGLVHTSVDLFTFGRPGPINDTLIERGIIVPWWTYPGYLVSFFRPLSALTHDIDGWLWPQSPAMAHVQSIAWYLGLLALVQGVYSKLVQPAWLAGLAFLIFVLDDTHADTVSWIANRHAIVATVLGLLAFQLHTTARAGGSGGGKRFLGPSCFAVSLLAGEAATPAFVYLLSYALFVDPASRRSRALSILPYAIVLLSWRAVYQRLGYGAFGSDDYIDPAREPLRFLVRFPQAFVVLLQGELGGVASDYWGVARPAEALKLAGEASITAAVFFWLVYPLLRRDKMARFWCTSLVGALVPSTASAPSDRTLLFAGVAGAGLLAQLFGTLVGRQFWWAERGWRRALPATVWAGLVMRKLLIAPLLFPIRDRTVDLLAEPHERAADAVPDVADWADKSLVIPNPPSVDVASFIPLIRATRGLAVPKAVRLFAASSAMTLTRTSDRALVVRPAGGFVAQGPDRVFRSEGYPLKLGETLELSDMSITVTELRPQGNPAAAVFAFREPLESPKYVWLAWDQHGCHSFSPPRIGETTALSGIDLAKLLREMWRDRYTH